MTVNINDLNDQWVALGQKVSDLQAKANAMVMDDAASAEDVTEIRNQINNAIAKRDLAKENLEAARVIENTAIAPKLPLDKPEADLKNKFVNDFIGMMKNDPKIVNEINSSTDPNGNAIGLTIPQDIQTTIHTLTRDYQNLQQYVNVESVSTLTGSRNYEKWSDITPLTELDAEDANIPDNDDPKLSVVKYLVKRYAGINTVTNSLLADTAENIITWLSSWIAKKVVVTRNKKIINALNAAPKKPTITKFDDVKTVAIAGVDEAIRKTSYFITNKSGFLALSLVKDATGKYLVTPDPTNSDNSLISGKQVVVVEDRWLPDTDANVHPLYFGDPKQAITLFDRQQMSLQSTNIGAGAFETDTTKIRVIDRFDVEATDTEALVAASFTEIADQVANIAPAATPAPAK